MNNERRERIIDKTYHICANNSSSDNLFFAFASILALTAKLSISPLSNEQYHGNTPSRVKISRLPFPCNRAFAFSCTIFFARSVTEFLTSRARASRGCEPCSEIQLSIDIGIYIAAACVKTCFAGGRPKMSPLPRSYTTT